MFEFKTTLSSKPTITQISVDPIESITRAASALLIFDFADKVYSFSDLDQFIYILNQNGKIVHYPLFTYLYKTSDVEVIKGKTYYSDVFPINQNTKQCIGLKVKNPTGNPKAKNYYEVVDTTNLGWRDLNYIIDNHFTLDTSGETEQLALVLSPSDTEAFTAGSYIECEAMVRINTTNVPLLGTADSTILEHLPSLYVKDSLYSKLR